MIPFACISGNFIWKLSNFYKKQHLTADSEELLSSEPQLSSKDEFRLLSLSVDSFTFRTAEPFIPGHAPEGFLLHFLNFATSSVQDLLLTDFRLEEIPPEEFDEEENSCGWKSDNPVSAGSVSGDPAFAAADSDSENSGKSRPIPSKNSVFSFCTCYRVFTESEDFLRLSARFQNEYQNYVFLKTENETSFLSKTLTGYPARLESQFAEDWNRQKKQLFASLQPDSGWEQIQLPPCGLLLDLPSRRKAYLTSPLPEFLSSFFQEAGLAGHPLSRSTPGYLYIGNQFCPHLFPDEPELKQLFRKAHAEGLLPVLVLAPASESTLQTYDGRLSSWIRTFSAIFFPNALPMEIIANDWGTVDLVSRLSQKRPGQITLLLGTLLQKRRKDPRLPYWKTWQNLQGISPLSEHLWNTAFYQNHLQSAYPVSGAVFESCGYRYQLPDDLHADFILPFYQTNTASFCTLYASLVSGARGKQRPILSCPCFCETSVFLYPEFLAMVGCGNSLFAFDRKIMEDSSYFSFFLKQGVRRLIFQIP